MVAVKKIVLIVNPKARGGRLGRTWNRLEPQIKDVLGEFTSKLTEGAGHATALCREALQQGSQLIVSVGGDGTASEVIAGFMEGGKDGKPWSGDACFSYLPYGTGEVLRRTFNTPREIVAAAKSILHATPRIVDVGVVEGKGEGGTNNRGYFLGAACTGISSLVRNLAIPLKSYFGRATYFVATLGVGWRYRNTPVRIRLDEEPPREVRLHLLAVNNGPFLGGGMLMAPEARVDDGWLDVIIMDDLSLVESTRTLLRVYSGRHLQSLKITQHRAHRISIELLDRRSPIYLDGDGEAHGVPPGLFSIMPQVLRLQV